MARYDSDVPAKITPFLAEVLRREQGAQDWTVIEFARRAEVDRSHLAEILSGKRSPTVETLERVGETLGFSLSRLFQEAERLRMKR